MVLHEIFTKDMVSKVFEHLPITNTPNELNFLEADIKANNKKYWESDDELEKRLVREEGSRYISHEDMRFLKEDERRMRDNFMKENYPSRNLS